MIKIFFFIIGLICVLSPETFIKAGSPDFEKKKKLMKKAGWLLIIAGLFFLLQFIIEIIRQIY